MPGRGGASASTSTGASTGTGERIPMGAENGALRHDTGGGEDGFPALAPQPNDPEPTAPSERNWPGWGLPAALLGLGTAALLALFWPTAWSLGYTWAASNSFGHGFLIVPIAVYLAWMRRHELAKVGTRPSAWGIALVGAAAFTWLLGEMAGASVVRQLALVAMLQGMTLGILGWRATKIVVFPLLYLYFAVPLGVDLIPPLQDFTAEFVVRLLRLAGVPVYLDGVFIQIPNARFEVAEACAGLRFLITSVALGTLFAYMMYRQMWRRVLFASLSIAVPIIANGLRATGIVMLAHVSDQKIAAGTDHITYGLIFLSFVLIALLGLGMTFREREPAPAHTVKAEAPSMARAAPCGFVIAFALALSMAGGAAAYSDYIARGGTVDAGANIALSPPSVNAPWARAAATESTWRPTFASADAEVL
ncbi:MAG: exosortase A, partial [Kiloniellaceae bacterium]